MVEAKVSKLEEELAAKEQEVPAREHKQVD